jgi:hypothetical protein
MHCCSGNDTHHHQRDSGGRPEQNGNKPQTLKAVRAGVATQITKDQAFIHRAAELVAAEENLVAASAVGTPDTHGCRLLPDQVVRMLKRRFALYVFHTELASLRYIFRFATRTFLACYMLAECANHDRCMDFFGLQRRRSSEHPHIAEHSSSANFFGWANFFVETGKKSAWFESRLLDGDSKKTSFCHYNGFPSNQVSFRDACISLAVSRHLGKTYTT